MNLTFTTNVTNAGFTMEVLAQGILPNGRQWRHFYRTPAPSLTERSPTRPEKSEVLRLVKSRAELDFRRACSELLESKP